MENEDSCIELSDARFMMVPAKKRAVHLLVVRPPFVEKGLLFYHL